MFAIKLPNNLESIYSRYSQEELMEYYTGIPLTNLKFCSPFREDNNPSCGYFWKGDKLFYKDYGGYFFGDWLDIASLCYNITNIGIRNKQEYIETIRLVCEEVLDKNIQISHKANLRAKNVQKSEGNILIEVKKREWENYDREFWNPITTDWLDYYNVIPVSNVYFNSNLHTGLSSTPKDPTYAYLEWQGGHYKVKTYKPLSKEFKWRNNYSKGTISGKDLSDEVPKILCTSLKDCIAVRMATGYVTYCGQGENGDIEIKPNTLVLIADNDEAGLNYASRLDIPYITLSEKDPFDVAKKKGLKTLRNEIWSKLKEKHTTISVPM